jgi:putative transposase
LKEAQTVIENWRQHYNKVRPHSSLGYRPPAPEALVWPAKPVAQMTALN